MPQCTGWPHHVKNKGIVFTDKDGNDIDDANDQDDKTLKITGVDSQVDQITQDTQQNDMDTKVTGMEILKTPLMQMMAIMKKLQE